MTEQERRWAQLLAGCRFLPGSFDKRFSNDLADNWRDRDLSDKQRLTLYRLLYRYRRQLRLEGTRELGDIMGLEAAIKDRQNEAYEPLRPWLCPAGAWLPDFGQVAVAADWIEDGTCPVKNESLTSAVPCLRWAAETRRWPGNVKRMAAWFVSVAPSLREPADFVPRLLFDKLTGGRRMKSEHFVWREYWGACPRWNAWLALLRAWPEAVSAGWEPFVLEKQA